MKYLIGVITLLLLIVAVVYGLLFTQPGNDFLRPILEKKIAQQVPLPTHLKRFSLRPDRFDVALEIGEKTQIEAKGTMSLLSRSVDAAYSVNVADLADLQKLIGQKLQGPFHTQGSVKGDQKLMKIHGTAQAAGAQTDYDLALRDFKPENLTAQINHLHIDKLLYMIGQPIYAQGLVDVKADIPSLVMDHLKGDIHTRIYKGLLHPKPLKRDFNLSIPARFTFKGDIQTRLAETKAISRVDFKTLVADLHTKALTYDIAKGALSTDYRLYVPNLDRLYFVTQQHMKGKITVTGKVESSKKGLLATAHSDTLGGAVDAQVHNNKIKATVKNIQTVALTDMLLYPHIFDSKANLNLDYDTVSKKGKLHAELLNGQILPNKLSFMLRQMANFDITREVYKKTTLDSRIDDKVLHNDLYMKSRLTEIVSKNGLVDLGRQYIDTTIDIKIRKTFIPVTLKGKLTDPKIKVDTKGLIKSRAKKELEKRLPANLKNSPAGDLIKNLF